MEQTDHTTAAVRGILLGCFKEMRLACATELARSRRYLEATALLTPEGRMPADAKELDLLARVAAQQRRFADAERLWNDAGRIAPENASYREAARCASRAGRNWIQIKQTLLSVAVALLLAGVILAAISFLTGRGTQPARAAPRPVTQAHPVPSKP